VAWPWGGVITPRGVALGGGGVVTPRGDVGADWPQGAHPLPRLVTRVSTVAFNQTKFNQIFSLKATTGDGGMLNSMYT